MRDAAFQLFPGLGDFFEGGLGGISGGGGVGLLAAGAGFGLAVEGDLAVREGEDTPAVGFVGGPEAAEEVGDGGGAVEVEGAEGKAADGANGLLELGGEGAVEGLM